MTKEALISTMKFTCIGKGHGAPCLPATKEDWENLRRESWLAQMCARIEKGDDELKHRLPVWTPHCAEFKDNHRAIADAVKPLNRLMLDFDEKGHTDEICARLLEKSPLVPLLIEESVRRGTHSGTHAGGYGIHSRCGCKGCFEVHLYGSRGSYKVCESEVV